MTFTATTSATLRNGSSRKRIHRALRLQKLSRASNKQRPRRGLSLRLRATRSVLLAALSCSTLAGLVAQPALANFKIDIDGQISGQIVTPANAVPGEQLPLITYGDPVIAAFSTEVGIEQAAEDRWLITAPNVTGIFPVHLSAADGTTKSIQLMVGEPFAGQTRLEGYTLGKYPNPGTAPKSALYSYPESLIELHKHNLAEPVSSHFRLGQFMCKQGAGWPRYAVIKRPLVVMLENIVTLLNSKGVQVSTLAVLSGYRTPSYNAGLDNVAYSRHIYGDAADIYVDADGDSYMDDLNGDGLVSLKDAQLLAKLIATLPEAQQSGIGVYPATSSHGPFVHVDTRGKKARWGDWN